MGLQECIEYLKTRFPDDGNQVRGQVDVYLEEAGYDEEEKERRAEGLNVNINDLDEIVVELRKRRFVYYWFWWGRFCWKKFLFTFCLC